MGFLRRPDRQLRHLARYGPQVCNRLLGPYLVQRAAWDAEWQALPEDVRETLERFHRGELRGQGGQPGRTRGGLRARRPDVPPTYSDLYVGFYEVDRDPVAGRLTMLGMNAVLDEYGYHDPQERRLIRALWRRMEAAVERVRGEERAKNKEATV